MEIGVGVGEMNKNKMNDHWDNEIIAKWKRDMNEIKGNGHKKKE